MLFQIPGPRDQSCPFLGLESSSQCTQSLLSHFFQFGCGEDLPTKSLGLHGLCGMRRGVPFQAEDALDEAGEGGARGAGGGSAWPMAASPSPADPLPAAVCAPSPALAPRPSPCFTTMSCRSSGKPVSSSSLPYACGIMASRIRGAMRRTGTGARGLAVSGMCSSTNRRASFAPPVAPGRADDEGTF